MSNLSHWQTVMLSTCLSCLTLAAMADNGNYNFYALAEEDYKRGRFEQALRYFDRALQNTVSKNSMAIHYMKANCLVQLNQPQEADREYAVAQTLAPGSQIARYCEAARANIRRLTLTPDVKSQASAKKNEGQADEDDEDDENPVTQKTNATSALTKNNGGVSTATLDLIGKQAALARRRALEIGDIAAENERIKAANEARSLQAKLERAASTPKNGTEPLILTPQQMEAIKGQAALGSEQLKKEGEWKAQQRRQESEDKSEEIRRQAENLKSQLINYRPSINSDIKLNPVGTNLYIRNYSKGMTPVVPLKAQSKSLPSYKNATEGIKGTVVSKQTSLNKVDARGTSSATSSSLEVNGQLIGRQKPTRSEHP